MADWIIVIEPGHGGLTQGGKYTTAPGKMWHHPGEEMHEKGYFYEGSFNREAGLKLSSELFKMGHWPVFMGLEWTDISLTVRRDFIHALAMARQKQVLWLSLHANMAGEKNAGKARGYEVCIPRQGRDRNYQEADLLAISLGLELSKIMEAHGSRVRERKQYNLFVTREGNKTPAQDGWFGPMVLAVVIEHAFFDNTEDAKMMLDPAWMQEIQQAQALVIDDYVRNNS